MKHAFDHIAADYDSNFTNSLVGKAQRELVWGHLEKALLLNKDAKILELNCGTGEDAKWMALRGANVLASDISLRMLDQASNKTQGLHNNLRFCQTDLLSLTEEITSQKFDIIFSNFGGLNCLSKDELKKLLYQLHGLLNENGKLIFIVMPTVCFWESVYFLSRIQWKKAFRRLSKKPVEAKLSETITVSTWYHSPSAIKKILPENMKVKSVKPIGFFIPPSYLNSIVKKRPMLFSVLNTMENRSSNQSFLASLSDHYYIEIKKERE